MCVAPLFYIVCYSKLKFAIIGGAITSLLSCGAFISTVAWIVLGSVLRFGSMGHAGTLDYKEIPDDITQEEEELLMDKYRAENGL